MAAILPRILVGPVVRRVEPRSCSFWIALSQSATVTALIYKGAKESGIGTESPVGQGSLATRAIGAALHVAVVTVDLAGAAQPLAPGELYAYDLRFAFAGNVTS